MRSAASVCGISCTSAVASPRCCPPRAGDSRRASATSAPTPRPCWSAGSPIAACRARTEASSSAVARPARPPPPTSAPPGRRSGPPAPGPIRPPATPPSRRAATPGSVDSAAAQPSRAAPAVPAAQPAGHRLDPRRHRRRRQRRHRPGRRRGRDRHGRRVRKPASNMCSILLDRCHGTAVVHNRFRPDRAVHRRSPGRIASPAVGEVEPDACAALGDGGALTTGCVHWDICQELSDGGRDQEAPVPTPRCHPSRCRRGDRRRDRRRRPARHRRTGAGGRRADRAGVGHDARRHAEDGAGQQPAPSRPAAPTP